MQSTKNQKKEELLNAELQSLIKTFYSQADVMTCIDTVTYLTFSIDENVNPLTSMDNVNMRSLMRLLIDVARLQREEGMNA